MTKENIQYISEVTKMAIDSSPEFQPWKDYFRLRAKEIELFLSIYDFKKVDRLLEIGCGNGFNTALFSAKANKIFTTDLYKKELETHSIGIEKAQGLLNKLGVKNCYILSCSGAQLPFKNGSFDCVLAIYTLEHIKERGLVLREEERVLKQGGIAINIVPNFVERLFFAPIFYINIVKRLIKYLSKSKLRDSEETNNDIHSVLENRYPSFYSRFRRNYPHFPAPEPHGEYSSFFIELKEYMPMKWLNLFKRANMDIVDIFSTMITPKSFLELFTDSLEFYEKHSEFEKRFGRLPLLKFLGQNLCIVTKKS